MQIIQRSKLAVMFAAATVALSTLGGSLCAESTLRVCDDVAPPASLNPYQVFSEKGHTVLQQMLEGLVRFSTDGKFEPALAESWEQTSPVTMQFKLRKGVKFHNGEPFNAAAVKFSIERFLNPQYPGFGFVMTIKGVKVDDEHAVTIETQMPDGLLLNRLAAWIHIVPPAYFEKAGDAGFAAAPVGTGPFAFESQSSTQLSMKANKEYWQPGSPKVDRLVFLFAKPEDQVKMLLSGEADLVTELPGTMTLEVTKNTGTKIAKQKAFWTVGATMNTGSGPLADVRVRRALNFAINREDLIRYDSKGNGSPLASLTMDGEEGHNPNLEPYAYDPEQAKKLLAEAGVQTPLVLKTLSRAQGQRTASILAAQLKKVGVQLDISEVSSDRDVIQKLQDPEAKWDMAIAGLPDPMCHSFFIQSILLFSQSPFSLQKNNAEFDGRLGQMMTELDPLKRRELGRELDAYVQEQALSLFTYQKIKTYGLSTKVSFKPYVSGMPFFFNTEVNENAATPVQASAPERN